MNSKYMNHYEKTYRCKYTYIFFNILQDTFYKTPEFYDHEGPTKTLTYLTLLVIYSGGGLMLIINVSKMSTLYDHI